MHGGTTVRRLTSMMNLTIPTPEQLKLPAFLPPTNVYRSALFNAVFPVRPYYQLYASPPLTKETIKNDLPSMLKEMPGRSSNWEYVASKEFYENPHAHQLYVLCYAVRYIVMSRPQSCKYLLLFHSKAAAPEIDTLLDFLSESGTLREFADKAELDRRLEARFPEICEKLSDKQICHELGSHFTRMPREAANAAAEYNIKYMLDALHGAETRGIAVSSMLRKLKKETIRPLYISFERSHLMRWITENLDL